MIPTIRHIQPRRPQSAPHRSQKLHRRHRPGSHRPHKHITNHHIPTPRTKPIRHRPRIPHPNLQPGRPRQIKPLPHQPRQLRINLHHRLPRRRIPGRKIPRQRTRPTTQMRHPQPGSIQTRINHRLTTSSNPPHILILQPQRIRRNMTRRHPIHKHLPPISHIRVRPQLHLTRRRHIPPSNRTHHRTPTPTSAPTSTSRCAGNRTRPRTV